MSDGGLKSYGCGCLGLFLFLWLGVPAIGFVWEKTTGFFGRVKSDYDARVSQRVAAKEAADQQRRAEKQRLKADAARKAKEEARLKREARLREFAVKEAPSLWKAYQDLQGAIAEQDKRIADLAKTLEEFDKDPSQDADYVRISSMRDEMVAAVKSMHSKIEDAYIAYCKFQATPSRRDYDELRRKILVDGIKEAETATKRFDQMRTDK